MKANYPRKMYFNTQECELSFLSTTVPWICFIQYYFLMTQTQIHNKMLISLLCTVPQVQGSFASKAKTIDNHVAKMGKLRLTWSPKSGN